MGQWLQEAPDRRRSCVVRVATALQGPLLMLVLNGCMLDIERPGLDIAIPAQYRAAPANAGAALPDLEWWRGFRSAELTSLIARAQHGNFDLGAALARIAQADAQSQVAGATLFPTVDLGGRASQSRSSGATGDTLGSGSERRMFSASLTASYILDIWGKNRAGLLSAEQSAIAVRYAGQVVALATLVGVANAYFQVLTAQERLRVADRNLTGANRILRVIKQRVEVGTASDLDTAQQESVVANVRASIPQLDQTLRQNTAALAVLLGLPPAAFSVKGMALYDIAIPRVTPGLPSDLLLQRPDIRQAEAELVAADASVKAAKASFFPSITLTGEGGFQSSMLKWLFTPEAAFYQMALSLAQPVLDGGRLLGEFSLQRGRQSEALYLYRKAVVSSFADVETALVAVRDTAERERLLGEAAASARRAFEIAETRLTEGTVDLVTVLNTQQSLFQTEDSLAQARLARLQAIVSLFQALGGGWPDKSPSAASRR